MKRNFYVVHSRDSKVIKTFKKLKSALIFGNKLIAKDRWCYISRWNDEGVCMETVYLRESFPIVGTEV